MYCLWWHFSLIVYGIITYIRIILLSTVLSSVFKAQRCEVWMVMLTALHSAIIFV